MKILITGGCGSVGHHFVEHFLKNSIFDIIIFDKLTYASNGLDRIRDIKAFDNKRVKFFSVDLTREISTGIIKECKDIDYIFHLAAETHVENSIKDPKPFIYSNFVGTYNLLEFSKKCDCLKTFLYFSTDEVMGPASFEEKELEKNYNLSFAYKYKEWDRYNCTNPYSATKAGAEQLVLAYMNTYKLPGFIVNSMNIICERQHPEKFVPLCINKILKGEKIFIHGTKDRKKSGTRFYIHARNVADCCHWLLFHYKQRDKYNIVGEKEISNLELAQIIAQIIGKPLKYEIVDFHSSRPGHDLRYSLDGQKLKNMGYKFPLNFEKSLENLIKWTLNNPRWLKG